MSINNGKRWEGARWEGARGEKEQEVGAGVNIEAGPRSFPWAFWGKGLFLCVLQSWSKESTTVNHTKKGYRGGNKNLLEPTWQKSSFQGHIAQCLYRSGLIQPMENLAGARPAQGCSCQGWRKKESRLMEWLASLDSLVLEILSNLLLAGKVCFWGAGGMREGFGLLFCGNWEAVSKAEPLTASFAKGVHSLEERKWTSEKVKWRQRESWHEHCFLAMQAQRRPNWDAQSLLKTLLLPESWQVIQPLREQCHRQKLQESRTNITDWATAAGPISSP